MWIIVHHNKGQSKPATQAVPYLIFIVTVALYELRIKTIRSFSKVTTIFTKDYFVFFLEREQYISCPELKWGINHSFHPALYVLSFVNEKITSGPFVQFALIRDIHLWKVCSAPAILTWAVSAPGSILPKLVSCFAVCWGSKTCWRPWEAKKKIMEKIAQGLSLCKI